MAGTRNFLGLMRFDESYLADFAFAIGNRNAHKRNRYPINTTPNLNLSASIQLFTKRVVSSPEIPLPALAMITSLIGYTKNIVNMIADTNVNRVISKKFL